MDDKFLNLKKEIERSIKELRSIFEKNDIYLKLEARHNKQMLDANFWQNKDNSKIVVKEKKLYESLINSLRSGIKKIKDLDELNNLAVEERNQESNQKY